jgi:kynurenine formamidase
MDLPRYLNLPMATHGGRSAWSVFGAQDSLGRLSLQDADAVLRGRECVRRGAVFALNAPIDLFDPPLYKRPQVEVVVNNKGGRSLDDALNHFAPQASSQWDALVHISYRPDVFYGGHTAREVLDDHLGTIDHAARRGIAGRAVLLDMESWLVEHGAGAADPVGFSVADLEEVLATTGLGLERGDVLLLRTGFLTWYAQQDPASREAVSDRSQLRAAGLDHCEEVLEWLWDSGVAAVASDSPSVEVWPPDDSDPVFGLLHRHLLGQLGFLLGELWWLDDLAEDCRSTGVHDMFLVSAPLNIRGGVGSTSNAIAIR